MLVFGADEDPAEWAVRHALVETVVVSVRISNTHIETEADSTSRVGLCLGILTSDVVNLNGIGSWAAKSPWTLSPLYPCAACCRSHAIWNGTYGTVL